MQALTLSKKTTFIKGKADAFHNIGLIYEFLNNLKEARKNYETAIKYYKELDDNNKMGEVYEGMASSYNREGNVAEALKSIYLSLKSFEAIAVAGNNLVSEERAALMVTPDENNKNGSLDYYFKYINK